MNKQWKRAVVTGMIVLLLAACGAKAAEVSPPENGLAPEKFKQYLGVSYPPLPQGYSESMSMLIQGSDDHSLSLVTDGANAMLWLSQSSGRDANGSLSWVVMDILDLSEAGQGMTLVPDACLLNGAPDSEVIAVSKEGKIQQAWRANTKSNVFEVLPATGIECHSDKEIGL